MKTEFSDNHGWRVDQLNDPEDGIAYFASMDDFDRYIQEGNDRIDLVKAVKRMEDREEISGTDAPVTATNSERTMFVTDVYRWLIRNITKWKDNQQMKEKLVEAMGLLNT